MKIEKGVGYVLIKDLARGGLCDCMWAVGYILGVCKKPGILKVMKNCDGSVWEMVCLRLSFSQSVLLMSTLNCETDSPLSKDITIFRIPGFFYT